MKQALGFALFLLLPAAATASGFLLFQHGGRTTSQAGAFAARASDPSAVRYNPAAIVRLDGFQFQAGLDFQAPTDEFATASRADSPEHVIQFPPSLYASWKPKALALPLAFGLSIDSPFWSIQNWNTALFPGRFDTLRQELTLFELRPTVAWAIDERWSLGGSLRYVQGALETSFAVEEIFSSHPHIIEEAEVESAAAAKVDGIGIDLALHFAAETWGAGVVASSGVRLDGDGEIEHFTVQPLFDQGAQLDFDLNFGVADAAMDFELPPTLTAGFWWSPTAAIAVEVDVAWSGWSALDRTTIEIDPDPFTDDPPALDRRRDWDDTLALRLGGEWSFASGWAAGAGLAWEPSPVPDATAEPGFPRGDAYVVALGGSYNMKGLSFDFGYSYYFYQNRSATLTGVDGVNSPVAGTFSARSQVFSISARWRR